MNSVACENKKPWCNLHFLGVYGTNEYRRNVRLQDLSFHATLVAPIWRCDMTRTTLLAVAALVAGLGTASAQDASKPKIRFANPDCVTAQQTGLWCEAVFTTANSDGSNLTVQDLLRGRIPLDVFKAHNAPLFDGEITDDTPIDPGAIYRLG